MAAYEVGGWLIRDATMVLAASLFGMGIMLIFLALILRIARGRECPANDTSGET